MNWRNKLDKFESKSDWKASIDLLETEIENEQPEIYFRVIFQLIDLLVEGSYSQDEYVYASSKVKTFFNKSYEKFSENSEYLFFTGITAYIDESHFGMEGVEPALEMLKIAMEKEPENVLFRWAYYFYIDQHPKHNSELKLQLAKDVISDASKTEWLDRKGMIGKYILGILESIVSQDNALRAV
jgi:hypothetical protein